LLSFTLLLATQLTPTLHAYCSMLSFSLYFGRRKETTKRVVLKSSPQTWAQRPLAAGKSSFRKICAANPVQIPPQRNGAKEQTHNRAACQGKRKEFH